MPSDDLADTLFGDTESLGDAGSSFPRFVSCDDFGVAVRFLRCVVGLRSLREGRIVEHLDDVKGRQPQVEASCGFEPLYEACSSLEPTSPVGTREIILPSRFFPTSRTHIFQKKPVLSQLTPIYCRVVQ